MADLWLDIGIYAPYLVDMAQIKFSKRALKNYRSQNMQMSHQELAACSGISVRSIARREDLNEPDLIDEEELAKLAHCLKTPQHAFWQDMNVYANFYGCKLRSCAELLEVLFGPEKLTDFDVRFISNDNLLQDHLLTLASAVELRVGRETETEHAQSMGIQDKLRAKIEATNAWDALTTADVPYAFYVIQTSKWNIGNFYEYESGGCFEDEGWVVENILVAASVEDDTPYTRQKTFIDGWFNGQKLDQLYDPKDIQRWLQIGRHDMISTLENGEVPF